MDDAGSRDAEFGFKLNQFNWFARLFTYPVKESVCLLAFNREVKPHLAAFDAFDDALDDTPVL